MEQFDERFCEMCKYYCVWLILLHIINGIVTQRMGKIYGGQSASIQKFPFLVSLQRGYQFKCGGTIISPSCVLTAAHCLENNHQNVQDLFVYAQQQRLSDVPPDSHVRQAWYAMIAPQYSARALDSDIAVIRLRWPFDISGNASIIQIDYNELPPHANLTIVGWGQTNQGLSPNQDLYATNVKLMTRRKCIQRLYAAKLPPITKNMFCALGENATDACKGDSGGPVLYGGRTVGIVSWGYECGGGLPGVYTRLSSPRMTWFLKIVLEQHC